VPSLYFVSGLSFEHFFRPRNGTGRDLLDLIEQVVDGLLRVRCDTDALSLGEKLDNLVAAPPRLARAGRASRRDTTSL